MAKAKLLFLSQTLPYPPDSGTAIRSYNVLRLLARDYDVTALCFYRRATTPDLAGSLAALRAMVPVVEAFPIEQEHSRARLVWDHARSLLTGRAYTAFAYESAAFTHALLSHLENETFALAHLDSLDLGAYVPALAGIPVVAVHQNVESALLRRRAANESRALRRAYLRMQARLMEKEEQLWSPRVALNLAVSDADAAELRALVPDAPPEMIPNGVDVDTFVPSANAAERWHRVRGRNELVSECGRALVLRRGDSAAGARARRVGEGHVGGSREARGHRAVCEAAYSADWARRRHSAVLAEAACYVVPLRIGGGTRLKILDAWAMGKAVVSTFSRNARDWRQWTARTSSSATIPRRSRSAVATVLHDTGLRAALERGARVTAVGVTRWDVIGERMRWLYGKVLAR